MPKFGESLLPPFLAMKHQIDAAATTPRFPRLFNESEAFQLDQNTVGGQLWRQGLGVDHDFRRFWFFIRIVDTGEFLDESGASFGIEAFAIASFADLQWRCYVHENEASAFFY